MGKDTTNSRKSEVIDLIRGDPEVDRQQAYFEDIRLRHRALPELDLNQVEPSIEFMGKRLSFPLLISSMTGGANDRLRKVNRNLAIAAEEAGVAMGVGSQRVAFSHPDAVESFELRRYAPSALLLANLGAVQLNYGFGMDQCRGAVEMLQADGLIFHLNPLQEAVQPEGNRNFSGLVNKIGTVVRALRVPVILKEVGSGIAPEDAELAYAQGIRYLDVAGAGGTSWSRIENHRYPPHLHEDLGIRLQDWGIPTPVALRLLASFRARGVTLIASGGVRSGLDMIKAMALGATVSGMAKPFLDAALDSPDRVMDVITRLKREFTTALFLLGIARAADLVGNTRVFLYPENPAP